MADDDKTKEAEAKEAEAKEAETKEAEAKALAEKEADDKKKEGDPDGDKDKEKEKEEDKEIEYKDFDFGKDVKVDMEQVADFKAVAKELKLTQEQAQSMINLQSKFADAKTKAMEAQFEKDKESWKAEAVKELGSDSKEQLALSAKAMDKFGSPELKTLLADSGLENRVEVIKFMAVIGKAVSEDKLVLGEKTKVDKTRADVMYGHMDKK